MRIVVAPRTQSRDLASRKATTRQHVIQIAPHWFPTVTSGQISEDDLQLFCEVMEAIADIIERTAQSPNVLAVSPSND